MARSTTDTHTYEAWRHGGWYVLDVRYPSGAVGCVSRNYPDRKWRIACDPRPDGHEHTYPSREAAADAEAELARAACESVVHVLTRDGAEATVCVTRYDVSLITQPGYRSVYYAPRSRVTRESLQEVLDPGTASTVLDLLES
jgi:hypothetical protein